MLGGLAQILGTSGPPRAPLPDRRQLEDRGVLLDLRLVALSFAVNALGRAECEDACCGVGALFNSSGRTAALVGFDRFPRLVSKGCARLASSTPFSMR